MNKKYILQILNIFLILIINSNSRYLHHSMKNLHLKNNPGQTNNHLSFLSSYLKKIHKKNDWHYIGETPENDIKYKRLIAASLKDSLINIYMNLMDDRRSIKVIFGKLKKKKK